MKLSHKYTGCILLVIIFQMNTLIKYFFITITYQFNIITFPLTKQSGFIQMRFYMSINSNKSCYQQLVSKTYIEVSIQQEICSETNAFHNNYNLQNMTIRKLPILESPNKKLILTKIFLKIVLRRIIKQFREHKRYIYPILTFHCILYLKSIKAM